MARLHSAASALCWGWTLCAVRAVRADTRYPFVSTVRELNNYSPFAKREHRKQKRNTLLLYGIIAVLALALLLMVVLLAMTVLKH